MLKEGAALTPNFWRAPTDNDMGAGLQNKYAAWKNPGLKLVSLNSKTENDQIVVNAEYDMKNVSAKLYLTYVINNEGAIKVTQKMTADKNATVSPMFRFGMQMQMPKCFETVEYYGRGPVENYSDRNHSTDLGIYRQSVDEQFYSYIRPQETGTKTDIRWWKQLNAGGNGLKVVGDAPFSASALHYTICSLDDGEQKDQRHSPEVQKADLTNLIIDKAQMWLDLVLSHPILFSLFFIATAIYNFHKTSVTQVAGLIISFQDTFSTFFPFKSFIHNQYTEYQTITMNHSYSNPS